MITRQELQRGVAILSCGHEHGSATVIAPDLAITARHVLQEHLDDPSTPIELHFFDEAKTVSATVVQEVVVPDEEDIALLRIGATVGASRVVSMAATHLPMSARWQSFGFPGARSKTGTWVHGEVANWLASSEFPYDVELLVADNNTMRDYHGFSGAPVWVGNRVAAILQRQLSGVLAATSILRIRPFLDQLNVGYLSGESGRAVPEPLRKVVATKPANRRTYAALENALHARVDGYTVLCGEPGSGKTVVAAGFDPVDDHKRVIGTYFAAGDGDASRLSPELYRDPASFASWLSREAALVTGDAVASEPSHGAREHAATIAKNLGVLGQHYASQGVLGVLIIDDGISPSSAAETGLGRLLPAVPPTGVAIVLTAASEAAVRSAASHLILAQTVHVVPLEIFDCERIVVATLKKAVQSADILRIASAANGNPLVLSYLIREATEALDAGLPLPDTSGVVPTADGFYQQQWARISSNDAGVWLVALVARLRGGIPATEIPRILPAAYQVGFPSAWRDVRQFLRDDREGVQVFHISFAQFARANTVLLDELVQDALADYCASESTAYARANVVYHHVRGSARKRASAARLCTPDWLDESAVQCVSPSYVHADVSDVLGLAIADGAFEEVVRLLLVRSRMRFRYDRMFAKYAFELAAVVSSVRSPVKGLRFVIQDQQLLCSPDEALSLIRQLLREGHVAECLELYQIMRQRCFAEYDGGNIEVTTMSAHFEALGLLTRELGPASQVELRALYRMLSRVVTEDGTRDELQASYVGSLPAAALLWRWGWFVYSVKYRESDPVRYATGIAFVLDRAYQVGRMYGASNMHHGVPLRPEVGARLPAEAAAEVEACLRNRQVPPRAAAMIVDVMIRYARDPVIVSALAENMPAPEPASIRQANGVELDRAAIGRVIQWNMIAAYVGDSTLVGRLKTSVRTDWERQFMDAFAWIGTTRGRFYRAQRDSTAFEVHLEHELLGNLSFGLAERAKWEDGYNLPEEVMPLLFANLCEFVVQCAPGLARTVGEWALGRVDSQLGLYTEGCRNSLWELAEGLGLCDAQIARGLWQAHSQHVLLCTANRSERVPALLWSAQGAANVGSSDLAERSFVHAVKASMGPDWYKEDQFGLLVSALDAASDPEVSEDRWRMAVDLLERASGDLTFQRFIRHEKEALIRHLSSVGRLSEAVALFRSYLWPDSITQIGRINSWRADHVTELEGGRYGALEIDPQAGALALLDGLRDAPTEYRWALIELYLPGDDRHFSPFADAVAAMFDSPGAGLVQERLLRLLLVDFVPEKRTAFVSELRRRTSYSALSQWIDGIERDFDWAREPIAEFPIKPEAPKASTPAADGDTENSSRPATEMSDDLLLMPGLIGRREGLRTLRDALVTAGVLAASGDASGARARYVEGLRAAQVAGWDVWRSDSQCRAALRGVLGEGSDVRVAIGALQPLIQNEEYAADWHIAEALIEEGLPARAKVEKLRVVEEVFAHARAILAPEMEADTSYEQPTVTAPPPPGGPKGIVEQVLLYALDDPSCHFRERAATLVRWLLDVEPRFDLDALLARAIAVGLHSREICLGVIHAWVRSRPLDAGSAILNRPGFMELTGSRSFAARYVASEVVRLANAEASSDASWLTAEFQPTPDAAVAPTAASGSSWRLQSDCADMLAIVGDEAREAAFQHLQTIAGATECSKTIALWKLKRQAVASDDFWSSACEREAVLRAVGTVTESQARKLMDELMWNPRWPDALLRTERVTTCQDIIERVKRGELDSFCEDRGRIVLHCREAMYDDKSSRALQLEIVACLVPSAYFDGQFGTSELFESRSVHGWVATASGGVIVSPIEPAVVRFGDYRGRVGGSMTPARPSTRLLELTRATEDAFEESSWRDGRAWQPCGVGRAVHDGTLLTMDARAFSGVSGMDLVWCFLRGGRRVALIDPTRRKAYGVREL